MGEEQSQEDHRKKDRNIVRYTSKHANLRFEKVFSDGIVSYQFGGKEIDSKYKPSDIEAAILRTTLFFDDEDVSIERIGIPEPEKKKEINEISSRDTKKTKKKDRKNKYKEQSKTVSSTRKHQTTIRYTKPKPVVLSTKPYAYTNVFSKPIESRPDVRIQYRDFLVRRSVFRCASKEHKLKDVNAIISFISDDASTDVKKTVHAGYCQECEIYFIMESTYLDMLKMGVPTCRITDEKTYLSGEFVDSNGLAKHSLLMDYGYNVSQNSNLSSTTRKQILARLIDEQILTKSEIISYLDFFISQRQSMPQYRTAISKWMDDREFVRSGATRELVRVRSIVRK